MALYYITQKPESFQNLIQGSHSGFGFQEIPPSAGPLFVNFYRKELGLDFSLAGLVRRLRLFYNQPTLTDADAIPGFVYGSPNSVRSPGSTGLDEALIQVNTGSPRIPIIIIPDIGGSRIFAKWSRNNTEYVKHLDAFGNFETADKWKCKDIETSWTDLWFPNSTSGLVEYCWSSVARIEPESGIPKNAQGVETMVPNIDSSDSGLNFIDDSSTGKSPYSTLVKSLISIGYVPGSTLFGAHYDFRRITQDMPRFVAMLSGLINAKNAGSGTGAIIIGHGFGAVIASNFIQQVNPQWSKDNIKAFVPINGSWGGVPKALKVLLSGDALQSTEESKLVRNTTRNYDGLQLLLPGPELYNNEKILDVDTATYTINQVPEILKTIMLDSNVLNEFRHASLVTPDTNVFIMAGTGLATESSYKYASDTLDTLVRINNKYIGDGTVPESVPMKINAMWSATNPNVQLKMYNNAEHLQILSMYEPLKDLLEYIVGLNKM
jgi:pimeloyl-ACP methyl ester carboxylesterase